MHSAPELVHNVITLMAGVAIVIGLGWLPCPPRGNAVCGEVAQAANAVIITATPGR
jgi:hypothetical protein